MTELLPCPFCGGSASLARCGFGTARATCLDCGSEGKYCQTHDEAITAWNTRAAPPPAGAQQAVAEDVQRAGLIAHEAQQFAGDRTHIGKQVYVNDLVWALGVLAAPAAAQNEPSPGSSEASAMIDSVLAEYGWPTNPKNAARAGFVAAQRLSATPAPEAAPSAKET